MRSGPVDCPETRTGLGPVLSLGNFIIYAQALGLSSSVDCDGVCLWGILSPCFLLIIFLNSSSGQTNLSSLLRIPLREESKSGWQTMELGRVLVGVGKPTWIVTHFCITRA